MGYGRKSRELRWRIDQLLYPIHVLVAIGITFKPNVRQIYEPRLCVNNLNPESDLRLPVNQMVHTLA